MAKELFAQVCCSWVLSWNIQCILTQTKWKQCKKQTAYLIFRISEVWEFRDFCLDIWSKVLKIVSPLIQGSNIVLWQGLYFLGLKILNCLVAEFNKPISGRSLSQHRKFAVHFRDNQLFGLFELSLTALQQLKTGTTELQKQVFASHHQGLKLTKHSNTLNSEFCMSSASRPMCGS